MEVLNSKKGFGIIAALSHFGYLHYLDFTFTRRFSKNNYELKSLELSQFSVVYKILNCDNFVGFAVN